MILFLILVLVSLIFSGFFSGIEIAFITANKLFVELKTQEGTKKAKILSKMYEKPSSVISTLLVGNNFALVLFGLWMGSFLELAFFNRLNENSLFIQENSWILVAIEILISTIVVLIFGEFLPKVLFQIKASKMIWTFTYPLKLIKYILSPVVFIMVGLSNFILNRIFKLPTIKDENVFTRLDLQDFINSSNTGLQEDINKTYFGNALKLTDLKVKECMIPRTEIKGIEINDTIEELLFEFKDTKLSKLIVYRESLDDIMGYIHMQKLFQNPKDIQSILMELPIVPENMLINNLMNLMSRKRVSIACVVDEFGGTSGIITHEDIIEEIAGEIEDEHDEEEYINKKISDNEYIFSGRLEVETINEMYVDIDIPEGDYQSLSGFILHEIERFPEHGDIVVIKNYEIEFTTVSNNKIQTLKLKVLQEEN